MPERDDVDDASVLADEHPLEQRLRDVEESVEVGAQHAVPVLVGHPQQQPVAADSGVVDQHLDRLVGMRLEPAAQGALRGLAVGHVEGEQLALAPLPANERKGLLGGRRIRKVVDQHMVAHAGQTQRHGASDAAACPRHEGVSSLLVRLHIIRNRSGRFPLRGSARSVFVFRRFAPVRLSGPVLYFNSAPELCPRSPALF